MRTLLLTPPGRCWQFLPCIKQQVFSKHASAMLGSSSSTKYRGCWQLPMLRLSASLPAVLWGITLGCGPVVGKHSSIQFNANQTTPSCTKASRRLPSSFDYCTSPSTSPCALAYAASGESCSSGKVMNSFRKSCSLSSTLASFCGGGFSSRSMTLCPPLFISLPYYPEPKGGHLHSLPGVAFSSC